MKGYIKSKNGTPIEIVDAKSREEVEALKVVNEAQNREIANLKEAMKGKLYTEETSEDVSYSKDIPIDVLPYGTFDYLGGRSVVKNQMLNTPPIKAYSDSYNTVNKIADNEYEFTIAKVTDKDASSYYNTSRIVITTPPSIWLTKYLIKPSRDMYAFNGNQWADGQLVNADKWNEVYYISNITSESSYIYCGIVKVASSGVQVGDKYNIKDVQRFNLTQMFGSGNEPTTVEEVEAIIGTDYIPYNAGELKNAEVESVLSRGRNLWNPMVYSAISKANPPIDNQDGTYLFVATTSSASIQYEIDVKTGHQYRIIADVVEKSGAGESQAFATTIVRDENKILLNNVSFNTGNSAKLFTPTANKIKVNISLSGGNGGAKSKVRGLMIWETSDTKLYPAGDISYFSPYFEPITKEIKPIVDKYFPNGMKSAGTVHDLFDVENGVAVTNDGEVDLGSLIWSKYNENNTYIASVPNMNKVSTTSERQKGIVCERYTPDSNLSLTNMTDKTMLRHNGIIFIRDTTYTESSAFKTAMQGVKLCFELADPITTPIDAEDLEVLKTLQLEGGGSLEFYQSDMKLPIPNKESWLVKTGGV